MAEYFSFVQDLNESSFPYPLLHNSRFVFESCCRKNRLSLNNYRNEIEATHRRMKNEFEKQTHLLSKKSPINRYNWSLKIYSAIRRVLKGAL